MRAVSIAAAVLGLMSAHAAGAAGVPLTKVDSQAWIRHTVPLPRQIEISAKVAVPTAGVAIVAPESADIVARQAIIELRSCLGLSDGGPPASPAFTITLQIDGPEAADLAKLRNADQACRITPAPDGNGLKIVATAPLGLYYGVKTLQQLVRPTVKDGFCDMPLLTMTDWPDMEDRGTWGTNNYDHIQWMADRKMNIAEQISAVGVNDDGRGWGKLKDGREPMIEIGPKVGLKPVPVVLHLEQVADKGVIKNYPQLKGQGECKEGAICYSRPEFVTVLADWIVSLRGLPGVEEVDVWMAENMAGQKGCQCDGCKKEDRNVLEARVINAAWDQAKKRVKGPLGLRILTSEETEDRNTDVFDTLYPDIKIWYYHSLLTYTAGETPMLRPYLEEYAKKKGRWIGVCPNIVPVIHFAGPCTSPHFIHYRLSEFVDKGMSGLLGYATPRLYYQFFCVEAAAEWAWNVKGRSPREFSASWAVRQGYQAPERFADWVDLISPVAWDIYGSDWPHGELRENTPPRVAVRLVRGELGPLGSDLWGVYRSPWADIKTVEQLNENVAKTDKALELAKELGIPACVQESLVVQGYIRSLKALWELKQIVGKDGIAQNKKDQARHYFRMYVEGLKQAADTIPMWERGLPMYKAGEDFAARPVKVCTDAIEQMKQVAKDIGVPID
ncbi:MAG TPA: glycoside hydrolase family 20 zincin-like fold domain-containing protein [Phycisphaerae bacterium]|nr:glycoside hydrolase family 20 zincin-like fold domain-containing protein [Phycisphaerae bacterium]